MNLLRSPLVHFGALLILIVGFFVVIHNPEPVGELTVPTVATTTEAVEQLATSSVPVSTVATTATTSSATSSKAVVASSTVPKAKKTSIQASKSSKPATSSPNDILRIENPYTTPPLTFEAINIAARAALVNIYCSTANTGTLKPITGSGIMVDPRGVVLTNAHVAQYVLISQSGRSDLKCEVRTGAPAMSKWVPVVLYIPAVWINQHANEIIKTHVTGTGEHDYALLYMAASVNGTPLPDSYAYVSPDTREAVAFVDDNVLAASYPVEFSGGSIIQSNLYPVSSITTVRQLLTFTVGQADAISLGGIIGAQSGSSGGGVVNQWNRLVGLITTTSEGATTGERDLHAITTAYINRDLVTQTGSGLMATLAKDPKAGATAFLPEATTLGQKLIDVVLGR